MEKIVPCLVATIFTLLIIGCENHEEDPYYADWGEPYLTMDCVRYDSIYREWACVSDADTEEISGHIVIELLNTGLRLCGEDLITNFDIPILDSLALHTTAGTFKCIEVKHDHNLIDWSWTDPSELLVSWSNHRGLLVIPVGEPNNIITGTAYYVEDEEEED